LPFEFICVLLWIICLERAAEDAKSIAEDVAPDSMAAWRDRFRHPWPYTAHNAGETVIEHHDKTSPGAGDHQEPSLTVTGEGDRHGRRRDGPAPSGTMPVATRAFACGSPAAMSASVRNPRVDHAHRREQDRVARHPGADPGQVLRLNHSIPAA
jgi:hypothetical protein